MSRLLDVEFYRTAAEGAVLGFPSDLETERKSSEDIAGLLDDVRFVEAFEQDTIVGRDAGLLGHAQVAGGLVGLGGHEDIERRVRGIVLHANRSVAPAVDTTPLVFEPVLGGFERFAGGLVRFMRLAYAGDSGDGSDDGYNDANPHAIDSIFFPGGGAMRGKDRRVWPWFMVAGVCYLVSSVVCGIDAGSLHGLDFWLSVLSSALFLVDTATNSATAFMWWKEERPEANHEAG